MYDRENISSQKAISLPSSPHEFRSDSSERSLAVNYPLNNELFSTWNKVLESQMFNNQPLVPYQEWNISFSELTVGTRVGIGKPVSFLSLPFCYLFNLLLFIFALTVCSSIFEMILRRSMIVPHDYGAITHSQFWFQMCTLSTLVRNC